MGTETEIIHISSSVDIPADLETLAQAAFENPEGRDAKRLSVLNRILILAERLDKRGVKNANRTGKK